MLTENDISLLVNIPEVSAVVDDLRVQFQKTSALEEISEHDFLSSMLMAPPIGMALANGTVSLLEELSLNKKARSFSKGGFFLKQDPVVQVVKYLMQQFDFWEDQFYEELRKIMAVVLVPSILPKMPEEEGAHGIFLTMMNTSYFHIKLLETFFLPEGEDIINCPRQVGLKEYQKLISIGEKLQLNKVPMFCKFLETFEVK